MIRRNNKNNNTNNHSKYCNINWSNYKNHNNGTKQYHSRLSKLLVIEKGEYIATISRLCAKISFAIVRSAHISQRGSKSKEKNCRERAGWNSLKDCYRNITSSFSWIGYTLLITFFESSISNFLGSLSFKSNLPRCIMDSNKNNNKE